jgi:hypothetical protein
VVWSRQSLPNREGHVYFVGEFSGTFFNDKGKDSLFDKAGVKCPAFNDLDLNNKKGKAGGYWTISDATGSSLSQLEM